MAIEFCGASTWVCSGLFLQPQATVALLLLETNLGWGRLAIATFVELFSKLLQRIVSQKRS